MAEVDQHAQAVHLPHHFLAEPGQASVGRGVGGRVGPRRVVVVGEGHVRGAQRGQDAQGPERGPDGLATLHTGQRGHAALGGSPFHIAGGAGRGERVRVAGQHGPKGIDLLQRGRDGGVAGQVGGHVHGPELAADATGPQARQVRHQPRTLAAQVDGRPLRCIVLPGLLANLSQLPQQIVVSIYQRRSSQKLEEPALVHRGCHSVPLPSHGPAARSDATVQIR